MTGTLTQSDFVLPKSYTEQVRWARLLASIPSKEFRKVLRKMLGKLEGRHRGYTPPAWWLRQNQALNEMPRTGRITYQAVGRVGKLLNVEGAYQQAKDTAALATQLGRPVMTAVQKTTCSICGAQDQSCAHLKVPTRDEVILRGPYAFDGVALTPRGIEMEVSIPMSPADRLPFKPKHQDCDCLDCRPHTN